MDELQAKQDAIQMKDKQDVIHEKGFDLFDFSRSIQDKVPEDAQTEYAKIKVGVKQLEDAILELGTLKTTKLPFCNKKDIIQAIITRDYRKLRMISDFLVYK